MIETLSPQERAAVCMYNQRIQSGDTEEAEIWADSFTAHIFFGHEGSVIDIGCGIGRVVPILEDLGISTYVGIDPSIEHIRFCQTHFPEHHFRVGEVRQLGTNDLQSFGGFIMLNVLMHIPKTELGTILKTVHRSQLKGAIGLLNTQHPSIIDLVPSEVSRLDFSFFEAEEVIIALEAASFRVISIRNHGDGCMYHVIAN